MNHDLELQKIIEKAGLEEAKIFVYKKNVRYIYKGFWNNKACLLKIIPKDDSERIAKAKTEIEVSELIIQHNAENPEEQICCNAVLDYGENNDFFWVNREFFDGDSLSGTAKLIEVPLGGYDLIKKDYLQDKKIIIDGIIKNLVNLQKINIDNLPENKFPKRFEISINKLDFSSLEEKMGIGLHYQIKKYNSLIDKYSSTKEICCMGDLVPSNVIITQDKRIVLTDFEYFCFDNSSLDLAYLWLYLWRYPDWQEDLLRRYPSLDKEDFQASILRILLPLFARKFLPGSDVHMQELYLKHKWKDYLIAAGESFDSLVNVK